MTKITIGSKSLKTLFNVFDIRNYIIDLDSVARRLEDADFDVNYELLEFAKKYSTGIIGLSPINKSVLTLFDRDTGMSYAGTMTPSYMDGEYSEVELVSNGTTNENSDTLEVTLRVSKEKISSFLHYFDNTLMDYCNSTRYDFDVSNEIRRIIEELYDFRKNIVEC